MSEELVPLAKLEDDLGLSRADVLLLLHRLRLEPVRRGLRTYVRADDVAQLAAVAESGEAEPVAAELVLESGGADASLPVPTGDRDWRKAELYADLRLFRERLDILEQLVRTGIEVESGELADLLQLKRLPPVEPLPEGPGFIRRGLRCQRVQRPGQRPSWRLFHDRSGWPDAA
jgi:hypothetical protein